jgi:hypothetical protein
MCLQWQQHPPFNAVDAEGAIRVEAAGVQDAEMTGAVVDTVATAVVLVVLAAERYGGAMYPDTSLTHGPASEYGGE